MNRLIERRMRVDFTARLSCIPAVRVEDVNSAESTLQPEMGLALHNSPRVVCEDPHHGPVDKYGH